VLGRAAYPPPFVLSPAVCPECGGETNSGEEFLRDRKENPEAEFVLCLDAEIEDPEQEQISAI
jgi:hypothetical protein